MPCMWCEFQLAEVRHLSCTLVLVQVPPENRLFDHYVLCTHIPQSVACISLKSFIDCAQVFDFGSGTLDVAIVYVPASTDAATGREPQQCISSADKQSDVFGWCMICISRLSCVQ